MKSQNDDSQKLSISDADYDSDEEPPKTEKAYRLSWRLEPSKSHSNWTIEILRYSSSSIDVYHVHKHFLAVGPRKSAYFTKLFEDGGRFAENQSSTSRIELDEVAANAFPDLLDFVYSLDGPLKVTTENATALHYLGQYFGMRNLRWEAKQFWKKDLTIDTCAVYYKHATLFQDEKVLKAAKQVATENVMNLSPSSPLVKMGCPEFWIELMDSMPMNDFVSFHLSLLIAELCNNSDIDAKTFAMLTTEKNLPIIHFRAALALLEIEQTVCCPGAGSLTSLQKRCIDAIAKNWHNLDTPREAIAAVLEKQNPLLLAELLLSSMSKAQEDKMDLVTKLNASRKQAVELKTSLEECRGRLAKMSCSAGLQVKK